MTSGSSPTRLVEKEVRELESQVGLRNAAWYKPLEAVCCGRPQPAEVIQSSHEGPSAGGAASRLQATAPACILHGQHARLPACALYPTELPPAPPLKLAFTPCMAAPPQAAWALEEKEEAEKEAEAVGEELREKQVRVGNLRRCARSWTEAAAGWAMQHLARCG